MEYQDGVFRIGYAKVNITPEESVPMAGMGNSSQRMSEGVLDPIFATCTAVSDGQGSTALFCSLDIQNAYRPVQGYRDAVSEAVGLPSERVMMCFTHDHSSVDIDNRQEACIERYNRWITGLLVETAKAALADLKPARMETASVQTEDQNFVRRYAMNDGTFCGDNFGSTASGYKGHETEADHTLQLIKFVREDGGDVIMANFQTHSNYTIHGRMLSSDVAGAFRDTLEELSGCHVIHFNGASGNINPKSRIPEENKATDHRDWGMRLARTAMGAEYTPLPTGPLKTDRMDFAAVANHSQDHLVEKAKEIREVFYATNDRARCREMGQPYGITSAYHAISIVSNANLPETLTVHMFVFSVGDVAFVFAPIEMFDTNGMYIKEHSPFGMTFICGYANYCQGYMPSAIACAHSGYEVLTSIFAPGNAERLADRYLELLKGLASHNDK